MKTNLAMWIGGLAIAGAAACATSHVTPGLLTAREAYAAAEAGPARELTPSDLHEAKVLLDDAERAARSDDESATQHSAYLAQRRAELADAQGKTLAANAEKARTQQQMQALKDQLLVKAKGELAQANATQAQTDATLSQTERQLAAEHQSRVEMHGQLAVAAADQQQTRDQLTHAQGQVDAEQAARRVAEQTALDALGRIAAVRQEARGVVITLSGSVLFASGKSAVLPIAQQRLDQVAEALRTNDRRIVVEGHSDSRGADAFNQRLSRSRAESVLDYLVTRDVARERVRAVGLGSSHPIGDNSTADGRANNRRVEIVIEAPRSASVDR